MAWGSRELVERHMLSLYFMLPLIGVCAGFLHFNWYPARVFPGDTLCYFCGMAFAVVGILGHFSKTLLLFFIPQIFNFLLSCPQLFGMVPCPRHRMPSLVKPDQQILKVLSNQAIVNNDFLSNRAESHGEPPLLFPSLIVFAQPPSPFTAMILGVLSTLGLTRVTRDTSTRKIISATNLTILNTILVWTGPITEANLTKTCILLQIIGSILGYIIRYGLTGFFYDGDRR